ncbi:unnamed protein product [Sympodiomycopsis kandeliae]
MFLLPSVDENHPNIRAIRHLLGELQKAIESKMSTWTSVESDLVELATAKNEVKEEIEEASPLKDSLQLKIKSIVKEDLEEIKTKIDRALDAGIPVFMDLLAEKRDIREDKKEAKEQKRRLAQQPDKSSSF